MGGGVAREGIDWTQRSLIELGADPVLDKARIEDLTMKARRVIELGPPPEPLAFGFGKTGLSSNAEMGEMIKLTSHAVQAAESRLHEATRGDKAYAAALINIAVVEVARGSEPWMICLERSGGDGFQRRTARTYRTESTRR